MKRIYCSVILFCLILFLNGRLTASPLTQVHGHRGGAGLMPENTIEAMIHAVSLGVKTLELDVQISRDSQVVVSHDSYMNGKFVRMPDAQDILQEDQANYQLFYMDYDSIVRFDCGSKMHPNFPMQQKMVVHLPLLSALIDSVEHYCTSNNLESVSYNVEIKSSAVKEMQGHVPHYRVFADLTMKVLNHRRLGGRLIVQSFDCRILNYLHGVHSDLRLSYLVEPKDSSFTTNLAKLDFKPEFYAPHFSTLNETSLRMIRADGLKVAAWTVDKTKDIKNMLELGVDVIISNYPNRVLPLIKEN